MEQCNGPPPQATKDKFVKRALFVESVYLTLHQNKNIKNRPALTKECTYVGVRELNETCGMLQRICHQRHRDQLQADMVSTYRSVYNNCPTVVHQVRHPVEEKHDSELHGQFWLFSVPFIHFLLNVIFHHLNCDCMSPIRCSSRA